MRPLAYAIAIGSMALLTSSNVGALPRASVESATGVETNLLLVRDGCGPGMRYSYRRDACVEDFDRGPPPPRYYNDYRAPPPRVFVPPPCPPGQRYSNYRQACVWL